MASGDETEIGFVCNQGWNDKYARLSSKIIIQNQHGSIREASLVIPNLLELGAWRTSWPRGHRRDQTGRLLGMAVGRHSTERCRRFHFETALPDDDHARRRRGIDALQVRRGRRCFHRAHVPLLSFDKLLVSQRAEERYLNREIDRSSLATAAASLLFFLLLLCSARNNISSIILMRRATSRR